MTLSLLHAFLSAKVDSTNATLVRPSNWNAEHEIELTGPALVGRSHSNQGEAAEIAIGSNVSISGDILEVVATGPALLGRTPASQGVVTEITLDPTLDLTLDVLSVSDLPPSQLEITGPSLVGRTAASLGSATEITLDTTVVLSSNVLSVGDIPLSRTQLTGPALAGRTTASLGDATEIALDSTIILSSNVLSVGPIPYTSVQLTGPAVLGRTTASLGTATQVTIGTGLSLNSDVLSSETIFFDTKADAEAATILSSINFLHIAGYTVVGTGQSMYKKVVAEPSHAGKLQSADGAWWELSEEAPSVTMFGVDMTGVADSATTFANAVGYASALGVPLSAPAGVIRLGSTVTIAGGLTFNGIGMPGPVYDRYPDATEENGTWFFFDHDGIGLLLSPSTDTWESPARTLCGFGTYREQPIPDGNPYTPNESLNWDIAILSCSAVYISDVLILNASYGILVSAVEATGRGSHHIDLRRIFGQPFIVGIRYEYSYDINRINEVHFWPFWTLDSEARDYIKNNAVGLMLGRVDNPFFDECFFFGFRYGIQAILSPTVGALPGGTVGNASFGMVHCDDSGDTGVYISADASTAAMTFDQLIVYGGLELNTTPLCFNCNGTFSQLRVTDLKTVYAGSHFGEVNGANSNVSIGHLTVFLGDQLSLGTKNFYCAATCFLNVGDVVYTDTPDDDLFGGVGIISCNLWRSYTPTISAAAGTFTSVSGEGWYRRIGDTVDLRFKVTITTNGTASSTVQVQLPFLAHASAPYANIGAFRDITPTGKMGQASIFAGGSLAGLNFYDNTYPGVDGAILAGSVTYRAET